MTTKRPDDEEWTAAIVGGDIPGLAAREAACVAAHNPKLAFVAQKICQMHGLDPKHLVVDRAPTQLTVIGGYRYAPRVSWSYLPRPMEQWLLFCEEAEVAIKAYEQWMGEA